MAARSYFSPFLQVRPSWQSNSNMTHNLTQTHTHNHTHLILLFSSISIENLEACNIEKSDGNIEFNFVNGNIDTKTGSNGVPLGVKRGHSIPYHHQQGGPPTPTPRGPRLTPFLLSMLTFSMLNSILTVFDINCFPRF